MAENSNPPDSISSHSQHEQQQHVLDPSNPSAQTGMIHSDAQGQQQPRKPKAPSVRKACITCHQGKTRCSEVLPCQNCLKRGLGTTCAYPDAESPQATSSQSHQHTPTSAVSTFAPPPMYAPPPNLNYQQYYDYNGTSTGASTSTFRPSKRPRNLTEEETAAITRNFNRGDFFVGNSAPVRIDPRLPVRLTLGEGDHVHFTVGELPMAGL